MIPILFIIFNLCFALLILFLTLAFVTGAPFVPSRKPAADAMINLTNIKPGMNVYDLGSGDGRLLFMAAEKGAQAIGFEINPFLVLLTYIKRFFSPYRSHIHVYWKNFWSADITNADVVFIYLISWRMDKLAKKLKESCRKGTVVVSNSFIFPGWEIYKKDVPHHVYAFKL